VRALGGELRHVTKLARMGALPSGGASRRPILAMRAWAKLAFRTRLLLATAVLFVVLVALRIHGSSIALAASWWAPDEARQAVVAAPIVAALEGEAQARAKQWLMTEPRRIRFDEWANEGTPYALAQFTHEPRFPVINTNVGAGQNMLVLPWAPVLHPMLVARPMTWGYLLLGPERGLAWSWWIQSLGCFVALFLLFELIVPGRPWLALLGSFWFCSSAYVVWWSLWPAYVTGLGVFALLGVYWLLTSMRPAVILGSGLLAALAFSGFCTQLYPPWQVPLGYTFVAIFVGLLWRDRPLARMQQLLWLRLSALGLSLVTALLVLGLFLHVTHDALVAFAESDYPGQRRSLGGDGPAWRLFGGFFNFFTKSFWAVTREEAPHDFNPSESAGFFLLLPAVVVAALVSPRIRARLGPVVWALLPWVLVLGSFCVTGVPQWFAEVTLLGHAQGYRAQLALGLASIVCCIRLVAVSSRLPVDRETLRVGVAVFLLCVGLYLWQGLELESQVHLFARALPQAVLLVAALAAALSALAAVGRTRSFALILVLGLLVTSGNFNPLAVGFPDWRKSELGTAISDVLENDAAVEDGRAPPLWLTYGGDYPTAGTLAVLMGARALGGVYYYPQPELWAPLDPKGKQRFRYNRFAITRLDYGEPKSSRIEFQTRGPSLLTVTAPPLSHRLWNMGARYVLTFGNESGLPRAKLELLHRGRNFAIYRIPAPRNPVRRAQTARKR
jgi:hypothetical protein